MAASAGRARWGRRGSGCLRAESPARAPIQVWKIKSWYPKGNGQNGPQVTPRSPHLLLESHSLIVKSSMSCHKTRGNMPPLLCITWQWGKQLCKATGEQVSKREHYAVSGSRQNPRKAWHSHHRLFHPPYGLNSRTTKATTAGHHHAGSSSQVSAPQSPQAHTQETEFYATGQVQSRSC